MHEAKNLGIKERRTCHHTCSTGLPELRLGPKVGQIGPKWDKSRTFSDQISVHFGSSI